MAEKEMFKGLLLGFVLLLSFAFIVSVVVAQIPPPPPTPESPRSENASAPPTPGTPPSGGGVASSGEETTPTAGGGAPASGRGGDSAGGGGDYARRRAGEGYAYGGSGEPSAGGISTGEVATLTGEAPPVADAGLEGVQELPPAEGEEATTAQLTEPLPAKKGFEKGYLRIALLAVLVLLAIAAIIWAIMRWRAHAEGSDEVEEQIKAAEQELYLQNERSSGKPAANKGPLPPGMR